MSRDQLSLSKQNPVPTGGVCLYSLAMLLRASRDGSGSPIPDDEAAAVRAYIKARVDRWGESRCESESHFLAFLTACLKETGS